LFTPIAETESYYETLVTTELPTEKVDGKTVVTDADDVFIVKLANIKPDELITLLDSKLVDKRDVAARFYALSLSLNHANVKDRQIYDALIEYDCHPEIVSVVKEIGRGVVVEVIDLFAECKVSDVNVVFCAAAARGRIEAMKLLELFGATMYDAVLASAAGAGQLEAMEVIEEWPVENFCTAFKAAAKGGHLEAMRRINTWGEVDYGSALIAAAATGRVEAMKLTQELGDRERDWNFSDYEYALEAALKVAKENDHAEAIELLDEWIAYAAGWI
jgi:hypothetical protein